jgi:hypothetical protein
MGRTEEELMAKRDELMLRDIKQIAQVLAYGVDLNKARQIDLTFWAPEVSSAKIFAEACKRNDMPPHTMLGPGATETNQRWLVRCPISASVTFVTKKENVITFLLFADKFDCEYDGWGTAIVEAAGSKETAH